MKEFKVHIPKEDYQIIEFRQEGLPGVMVLNRSLNQFEPKEVFEWQLSIILNFELLIANGMPSREERDVVEPYEDELDLEIKGADADKPNALFLARITWNKTREYIYRVFDAEQTHLFLKSHIESKKYKREFDFQIKNDPQWKLCEWHLGTL